MLRESVPLSLSLSLFISLSSILVPPSFPLFSPSLHPSFPRGSTNDTPTNRLREQLSVKLLLRLLAAATQSTRWRLCNTIEAEKYRRLSVITRPILHVPTSIDYERVFLWTGSIEVSLPGCSIFPEQVNKGFFLFFPQRSDNRCLYDFRVCWNMWRRGRRRCRLDKRVEEKLTNAFDFSLRGRWMAIVVSWHDLGVEIEAHNELKCKFLIPRR